MSQMRVFADLLKIRVPDPGDVMTIRRSVIQAEHGVVRHPKTFQISQRLIASRGILYKNHLHICLTQAEIFHPAEAAVHIRQGPQHFFRRKTGCRVGADRSCGIIDIINSRNADGNFRRKTVDVHMNPAFSCRHAVNGSDGHRRIGAVIPAFRTDKTAQMRIGMKCILIFGSTVHTIAGIGNLHIFLFSHRDINAVVNNLIRQILRKT